MKKTLKVIFIIAVMLFGLLGVSQNISFAEKADVGGTLDNVNSATGAATIGGNIVNWIWGISIVVAVVVVMITGLKFIVGSTQEKAEYKKSLIPLVVGVLILVFATTIVKVLFGMGGK